MTSKKDKKFWDIKDPEEPKTPHEEVMFVVESNNEILSKISEIHERCCKHCPFTKECCGEGR